MFNNPRRGRQARNLTKNVAKILDLKSSSEQIFSENWRWVPLLPLGKQYVSEHKWELTGQVDFNFFSCPVWAHGDRENCSSSCLKSTCELLAESIFLYTLFEDPINNQRCAKINAIGLFQKKSTSPLRKACWKISREGG